MLHVAADTTYPGVVGPVFHDMSFEFIPINNTFGTEKRTYFDVAARNVQYGKTLADFLPSREAKLPVHFDPDFNHFTYAQHGGKYSRFQTVTKLRQGDVLFLLASLAPYKYEVYKNMDGALEGYQRGRKNKYIIGFFTVQGVARVNVIRSNPRLAITLFSILEDERPINLNEAASELATLVELGYITKKEDSWELTDSGVRTVEGIADGLSQQKDDSLRQNLLEKGEFVMEVLCGSVHEDDVKSNHHYQRLRTLDWDYFGLVKGDSRQSALLSHAVQLTSHYDSNTFILNNLGQSILRKASDSLRGTRWIDDSAVRQLLVEMAKTNSEISERIPVPFQ